MSEEVLQRAGKRKVKGKGERKYRVPENSGRDRKTFINEQCKEIEENDRMLKTRDLFKKKWRYQGNISCKDGHLKDRNGENLTVAEEIKKR